MVFDRTRSEPVASADLRSFAQRQRVYSANMSEANRSSGQRHSVHSADSPSAALTSKSLEAAASFYSPSFQSPSNSQAFSPATPAAPSCYSNPQFDERGGGRASTPGAPSSFSNP